MLVVDNDRRQSECRSVGDPHLMTFDGRSVCVTYLRNNNNNNKCSKSFDKRPHRRERKIFSLGTFATFAAGQSERWSTA